MQLVIEIPEEEYNTRQLVHYFGCYSNKLDLVIYNGTPLPEHHGRIGDLDAVMSDINNNINEMTNIGIAIDGEYLWGKLNDAIDNAQTIIEAEGSGSE